MRTALIISTLLIGISACNIATDKDYENLANDLCDCYNQVADDLSPGLVASIIDAEEKGEDMLLVMKDYMEEAPDLALKDLDAMEAGQIRIETECMDKLEKKYEGLYSTETQTEMDNKLLKFIGSEDGCEFTNAMMKLGKKLDELGY